jgi:hypothetical protein
MLVTQYLIYVLFAIGTVVVTKATQKGKKMSERFYLELLYGSVTGLVIGVSIVTLMDLESGFPLTQNLANNLGLLSYVVVVFLGLKAFEAA